MEPGQGRRGAGRGGASAEVGVAWGRPGVGGARVRVGAELRSRFRTLVLAEPRTGRDPVGAVAGVGAEPGAGPRSIIGVRAEPGSGGIGAGLGAGPDTREREGAGERGWGGGSLGLGRGGAGAGLGGNRSRGSEEGGREGGGSGGRRQEGTWLRPRLRSAPRTHAWRLCFAPPARACAPRAAGHPELTPPPGASPEPAAQDGRPRFHAVAAANAG